MENFNWLLFVFAMLGLAVGLGIEFSRDGGMDKFKKNKTAVIIWVSLFIGISFATVFWIHTTVVQSLLAPAAICGLWLVRRNNLPFKN